MHDAFPPFPPKKRQVVVVRQQLEPRSCLPGEKITAQRDSTYNSPKQHLPTTPTRPPVTKRENGQEQSTRSPATQLIRHGIVAIGLCLFFFGAWNVRCCLISRPCPRQICELLRRPGVGRQHPNCGNLLELGEPGAIKLEADVGKQDAIVTAFKVQ